MPRLFPRSKAMLARSGYHVRATGFTDPAPNSSTLRSSSINPFVHDQNIDSTFNIEQRSGNYFPHNFITTKTVDNDAFSEQDILAQSFSCDARKINLQCNFLRILLLN
jgi:hypothetical protein